MFGVQVEPISPLIRIQNLREIIVTQRNDLIKFPFKPIQDELRDVQEKLAAPTNRTRILLGLDGPLTTR